MAQIKNQVQKFLRYWVPVILYAGFIFWLSSIPEVPSLSLEIPFLDKIFHIIEYLIFGLLLCSAFKSYGFTKITFWVIFVALLYGISDEIHQYFIPNREASLLDLVFDGLGAYLGALFIQK